MPAGRTKMFVLPLLSQESIVPNSRSIAGGPQIFAPIAKYACSRFDDAVTVAGIGDPGRLEVSPHLGPG
jgi:hypothetical protein